MARFLLLTLALLSASVAAAQEDDASARRRLSAKLRVLQRTGNYPRLAELYTDLANLSEPRVAVDNLVNAGRQYLYAYRYRRRRPRYLQLGRLPLRRAIEIAEAMPRNTRSGLRYGLRSAHDLLADLALSEGRPDEMYAVQQRFLRTVAGGDQREEGHARVRLQLARFLLGDRGVLGAMARLVGDGSHLRYQVYNVVSELQRQARELANRPDPASLARERALRAQAAELARVWVDASVGERHFNTWNYAWGAKALAHGGEWTAVVELVDAMDGHVAKKPLKLGSSNGWQNRQIDEARLQRGRALVALGQPGAALAELARLDEQVYLIEPGGAVVGNARWLGRERRADGRGVTRLEVGGRVARYVDLHVYPGGITIAVPAARFGKHLPREVRVLQRPYVKRFELVAGLAAAAQERWRRGDARALEALVLPALVRLRRLLRRMTATRYREVAGKVPGVPAELPVLGWRVELDLAWARLAAGRAAQVAGQLHALRLAPPPSQALADELARAVSAAAGAAAPRRR